MEVNSTWLIASELANHRARKVVFTVVVYANKDYPTGLDFFVLISRIAVARDKRLLTAQS